MIQRCAAIVPAAGQGKRMQTNISKQYLKIKDRPILSYTLEALETSPYIQEIIVAVGQGEVDFCVEEIIKPYNHNKVINVIEGGKERQESVYKGLSKVSDSVDLVLIHDGVRPFIKIRDINNVIESAAIVGASILGVKVKDTIKEVNEEGYIVATYNREVLRAIQTPQVFCKELLVKAHEYAIKDSYLGTDDAVLVEKYMDTRIKVVEGDYTNIKITTPEDWEMSEWILRNDH